VFFIETLIFFLILTYVAWSDFNKGVVPNYAVLAIILMTLYKQPYLYGFISCFSTALILYSLGLIGAGDAKLAGATGLFCGLDGLIIFLLTLFAAALYGAVKSAKKGEIFSWLKENLFLIRLGPAAKEYIRRETLENAQKIPLGTIFLPAAVIVFTLNLAVNGVIC